MKVREIMQDETQPQNTLESTLLKTKAGAIPLKHFLHDLLESQLFVASGSEIKQDGTGFAPLLFDRDGIPLAAVFTTLSRATKYTDMARYSLQMNGRELFARMPDGYGLALNPNTPLAMEIQPHGVKEILQNVE